MQRNYRLRNTYVLLLFGSCMKLQSTVFIVCTVQHHDRAFKILTPDRPT